MSANSKDYWAQFEIVEDNKKDNYWAQFEQIQTDDNYNGPVIENFNPKNKLHGSSGNLISNFKECLEWIQKTPISAYQEGKNMVEIADLEMKSIYPFKSQSEEDKKRLNYLNSKKTNNYGIKEPKYKQKDPYTLTGTAERAPVFFKKGYIEAIKMSPILFEMLKSGGIGSVAGTIIGAGGAFTLGQIGPNIAMPDELLTMPTAAIAGAKWGGGINSAKRSFEIETGLAKNELRQINNEIISNGGEALSENEMNLLAIGVGGFNAGLEFFSLKAILKTLPGGETILKRFENKQLKELAADKTIRTQLMNVLKNYGAALGVESSTEMAQEAANIVAGEFARKLGGIENTPLEQNVARILETGTATLGATIFLGGAGSIAQTTTILTKQGLSRAQAQRRAENMTNDERHNFIDNNFGTLVASIEDMPSVKEFENQQRHLEARKLVSDDISKQMIEAGRDEQEAHRLGELAGIMYEKIAQGDNDGKTAYDIYNKYNLKINNDTEQLNHAQKSVLTQFQPVYTAGAKNENVHEAIKEWSEKGTESTYFKNWFDNSHVVDETGKPLIVYHGSVQTFDTFDKDKASPEGNMGAGFYFSDSEYDVNDNYYDGGPDFEMKAERLAEKLQEENENLDYEEAIEQAETQLRGEPHKFSCYLKMNNPCYVGDNATWLLSDIFDDINISEDEYEDYSDYENARYELEDEVLQNLAYDIDNALGNLLNYSDIQNVKQVLFDSVYEGGIRLEDLKSKLGELYLEDYQTGEIVSNETARRIVEMLGYDGIIDNSVSQKFNMNIPPNTTHYIVFNPEQIKSIDNQGTFDENNSNIYYQSAYQSIDTDWRLKYPDIAKVLAEQERMKAQGLLAPTIEINTEERQELRNNIAKDLYGNGAKNKNKQAYLVIGLPASGKSAMANPLQKKTGSLIIDSDMAKEQLPEFIKSNGVRADQVHEESQYIANKVFENAILNGDNVILPIVGKSEESIMKKYESLSSAGYDIHLRLVYLPVEIALDRAVNRFRKTGRLVPVEYIVNEVGIKPAQNYVTMKEKGQFASYEAISTEVEYGQKPKPITAEEISLALQKRGLQFEQSQIQRRNKLVQRPERGGLENRVVYHQSAMRASRFKDFSKFYNDVVSKPKNTKEKEQFNYFTHDGLNLRIPHDTILHEQKKHSLTQEQWQELLNNIDSVSQAALSRQKSRFNGKPLLLKIVADNNTYGVVLETFAKNNPLIATAFMDSEKNIDNWIKNEAISSGTKTTFLSTRLIDIITGIQPKFKPYTPERYYQDIYHESLGFSLDNVENNINSRGSISFFKDEDGNIRQSVIDLVSGKADKSTMLHEFSHLFLQTLIMESPKNIKAREMLLTVNKWLKYNGGEYTYAQHEKFAQGFEAYLMSGKAPTSKLKQVFEKFAKWLKDIYTNIEGTTSIKLSKEAKEVFDALFGDENFEEQKKKSIEIIEKSKYYSQAKYKPTEEQLRHREIAYNILAAGINRNPKWLKSVLESSSNTKAMRTKKERIFNALDKVDDKITINGFDPSWLEFFSEKGVSYNNDEVGADAELVRQAYDVIVNKLWLKTNEEYHELQETELQYQYILNEYEKSNNSDDRTIVLLAYYDWLESVPQIVQNDYGEKWLHDTNEIERFEHLNKFEQAKEILLNNAGKLRSTNGVQEYKNIAAALLKSLDFLSYSDRNKILNKIVNVENVEQLKNNIDEIMDFAQCLEDMSTRRDISERIQDELRSTRNIKTNGRTRGKYDYSTNKLFEKLRAINRLNLEQAETIYAQIQEEFSAMSEDERETMSFEDKITRKFVTYKAYGQMYISSDFLSDLYADIVFAKLQGKLSKDETDFNNRIENNRAIDAALDRLEDKKPAKAITKLYTKFANLESFINLFFDKKFTEEYSILYEETQVQTKSYIEKQEILKKIADILNVRPFFVDDKIFEKLNEKYTFKDYSLKRPKDIELNKMQIIQAYIYSKNPLIKERLLNMFGQGGCDRIMSLLDYEDIQIGDILQRSASSYYNEINQIYIKKYGIDMPRAKNYFPVAADVVRELDIFNQYSEQSTSPGFTKSRNNSDKIPIKLTNPIQTLFNHIEKANALILLEDKLTKLNKVFKDRNIAVSISEKYGNEAYESFLKQITDCSYTKRAERLSAIDSALNKVVNNIIGTTITLKPKIAVTQLVSVINFADKMPATQWFSGFMQCLLTPRKTIKFMMQCDYLLQRFGSGSQNEALARIVETSRFAKSKKFIDFFSLNVKLGDMGAIIFGGKPYVDYLMNSKGMSREDAFREFVLEVNRAQQGATTSSLNEFQRSKNPIFRLYYAFQNTTNQYFRKAADAIIARANGDISRGQMIKTILIYTVFNNFLYRMVANPYVWILGLAAGDWEEFANETIMSVFDLNSQSIIFIGSIYQAILNALLEKPVLNSVKGLDKIPRDINKLILEAQKDGLSGIELDTWLGAMTDIIDATTGIPASTIVNMGSSVIDFYEGEAGKGVMKLLGYSDYQARKALGED